MFRTKLRDYIAEKKAQLAELRRRYKSATRKIEMEYPYYEDDEICDGYEHVIHPKKLERFSVEGREFYILKYRDRDLKKNMLAILTRENQNFLLRPLVDADIEDDILTKVTVLPTNKDMLPDVIELGTELALDDILASGNYDYNNDFTSKYIVYITNDGLEVSKTTYNRDLYPFLFRVNPNRHMDSKRVSITKEEIELITKLSRKPQLIPSYVEEKDNKKYTEFIVYENIRGLEVDRKTYYEVLIKYIGLTNCHRRFENNRVSITKEEIEFIELSSSNPNLKANYQREKIEDYVEVFKVYKTSTGLEVNADFFNNYLYRYFNGIMRDKVYGRNRVGVTEAELEYIRQYSHTPHYEVQYVYENDREEYQRQSANQKESSGTTKNKTSTTSQKRNNERSNTNEFNVFITEKNTLEVTLAVYYQLLYPYIGYLSSNRQMTNDRAIITQEEIDIVIKNSENPVLKPKYMPDLSETANTTYNNQQTSKESQNAHNNEISFIVYQTVRGLEVDLGTYYMALYPYIGYMNPNRTITSSRASITEEEIKYVISSSNPSLQPTYIDELGYSEENQRAYSYKRK